RHLTGGARAPRIFTIVPSTANPPRPKLWLQAGADTARPNAGEIQRNHPKTPPTTAEGGFRREVQPRRQHWFLNEKSGFPFRTPAFCSVSRGQRRLGEKEY